jgi:Flp pilus assembly secretin CpaC
MPIIVNLNKAKAITHDLRRAARADELAPLDAVIAKQIPGTDAEVAEASRQIIRDKYAETQVAIDAAADVAALKTIVEQLT